MANLTIHPSFIYLHMCSIISHVQIEEGEELRTELENKLRTEQTRRHHLQSRLVTEEAEHRAEMEDFEKRFFALQRRVDAR